MNRNIEETVGPTPPYEAGENGGRRRAVGIQPPPPPQYIWNGQEIPLPHPDVTVRTTVSTREITVTGASGKVPFGYGRFRTAGNVLYYYSNGNDLWFVIGFCKGEDSRFTSGPVDSLAALYPPETPNASMGAGATINTGRLQAWFHEGTLAQTVDVNLASVDPTWNEDMVHRDAAGVKLFGICYAVVRLIDVQNNWQEFPNLIFEIKGRKVLDPRTGTIVYSENTVLQFYDWSRDPDGKAIWSTRINTASINAAATIADEVVGAGVRYSSHLLMADAVDVEDWVKTFKLLSDGRFWFYSQNQWYLILDRPAASVAAYDDSAIALEPAPQGERGDPSARINDIAIEWLDRSNGWVKRTDRVTLAGVTPATKRTATYRLPWLQDYGRVQRLLTYLLNSYAYDFTLQVTHGPSTTSRMVGDVITQSVASRGIGAQQWHLAGRTKSSDGTFQDVLLEYNVAKYSNATGSAPAKIASTLPDPNAAPPEVVDVAASCLVFSPATVSFNRPQIRSTARWGAAFWTALNLGSYDGTKVNDGITTATAFHWNLAGTSTATLDLGVGNSKRFLDCVVATSALLSDPVFEYSDDGSAWTSAAGTQKSASASGGITTRVYYLTSALPHRYWRLRKGSALAENSTFTEVHFREWLGPYPWLREYRIYNTAKTVRIATIPAGAEPPAGAPHDIDALATHTINRLGGGGSALVAACITSVNLFGTESVGVDVTAGQFIGAVGTYNDTWVAQSTATLTLANGLNSNIALPQGGPGFLTVAGPSSGFSLGGFDHGSAGTLLRVYNGLSQTMTVVNESVSSTDLNRIKTLTGASVVLTGPGYALFEYVGSGSSGRWVLIGWFDGTIYETAAHATATFAPLASPALTGTPTAPTAAPGTNSTQLATTAYVVTSFAPLASPALTGTPTAPTAAPGTNTTQIATTAFVLANGGGMEKVSSLPEATAVGAGNVTTRPKNLGLFNGSASATSYTTILNISGKGFLNFLAFGTANAAVTATLKLTVDGVVVYEIGTTETLSGGFEYFAKCLVGSVASTENTGTGGYDFSAVAAGDGFTFKTSLKIEIKTSNAGWNGRTAYKYVLY